PRPPHFPSTTLFRSGRWKFHRPPPAAQRLVRRLGDLLARAAPGTAAPARVRRGPLRAVRAASLRPPPRHPRRPAGGCRGGWPVPPPRRSLERERPRRGRGRAGAPGPRRLPRAPRGRPGDGGAVRWARADLLPRVRGGMASPAGLSPPAPGGVPALLPPRSRQPLRRGVRRRHAADARAGSGWLIATPPPAARRTRTASSPQEGTAGEP